MGINESMAARLPQRRSDFSDGMACGLAMSAVMASSGTASTGGDELAAALLRIVGARTVEDVRAMRNNPIDEYDADFLVSHFGGNGTDELAKINELAASRGDTV